MNQDTTGQWAAVAALFDKLHELDPEDRERALARADVDEATRDRVRRMFRALESQPGFLEKPAESVPEPETPEYSSLSPEEVVGDFRIEKLIGRGGMGEVYLAVRHDADFEQHVALKLIRPEAAGAMAHFGNERRILAALEHPGIARLVDGGIAPDGRPYMAMEYVDGLDILRYADAKRLGLDARLNLFREICNAVDFAHRNLVVHRDLKPANILVTGDGHVKLLDFGIARLMAESATPAQTLHLLTPDYAAPEQIEGGAITMATDVYSLGLLLFELLVGASPWRLRDSALPTTLARRLEADPPPPSEVATRDGPVLRRKLFGDLDAIVLKALRREPAARYQSASQLWNDIARHQRREPVHARGDTRGYRLRRFISRHRVAVAVSTAVMVPLLAGLVGVAWQAREAERERDQARLEMARAEAVKNYLMLMFRTAGENAGADSLTAKQVLDESAKRLADQYRDQPQTRAELLETLGALYGYMNDYEGAAPLLREFLATPEAQAAPDQRAEISLQLAEVELRRGNTAEARRLLDEAQAYWNADPGRHRIALLGSRQLQAQVEREESGLQRSIDTLRAALVEHDAHFGREHASTASLLNSLGIAYMGNNEVEPADAAFADAWAAYSAIGQQHSAGALLTLGNWAAVAFRKSDLAAAEERLRLASGLRRDLYGPSAALAAMQANLGKIILRGGRADEALPLLEDALAMSRQYTGEQSPLTVAVLQSLAETRLQRGELDLAAARLDEARAAARAHSGEDQVLYALCDGLEARLRLARGDAGGANAMADVMAAKLAALGPAGAPYQPELQRLRADLQAAVTKKG
ncbi:serine/threonine-protein kinase [Arenimonas daejeonensis]|uniref:serine/threonine-protein kinase n=1 Tax=Arenimonas daejeonensis TaxID=370777 RepID=UPI0011BDFBC0|nr:serine/threonine-protein kinase [Arenimonas daejeonensis]